MKKIYLMFIVILSIGLVHAGEITKKGTSAATFLKIGVGARAAAMGEAYAAEASDASAVYWNPAGLAAVTKNEMMLVRTNWIADMRYDVAALAIPFSSLGTFGLFYQALNMDDMKVRTEFDPDGTGELFGASSFTMGLTYAKNMTDRFAFGITAKYIREQIWHESASTMALDVGITYKTPIEALRLGMAITNYGGSMRLDGKDLLTFVDVYPSLDGNNEYVISRLNTESYDIPLSFRVGLAYDALKSDFQRFTIAIDGVTPNDNNEHLNVGMEYGFRNMVFLRAGYKGIGLKDSEVGFSAGAGLKYSIDANLGLAIDYAYVDFGRFTNVQRFSLSILF